MQIQPPVASTRKVGRIGLIWFPVALGAAAAASAHYYVAAYFAESATPFMILDRVFDVGLVILLSLGWIGLGRYVLRAVHYEFGGFVGDAMLAWGLGAGISSHVLLGLGIVHLLYAPVVVVLFGGTLVLTHREWRGVWREGQARWQSHTAFTRTERVLLAGAALLIVPVFLSALTPPIEGDALSYQLAAPAQFLAEHAIVPLPANTGANYPLGAGLLFVFGLALGSPIAAQLIVFVFGLALTGVVYAFAAENFTRPVGIAAAMILWTSAVIGLEASAPLVDLGWVLYEFVAIWLFWRWHKTRTDAALLLAGLAMGFAVSSKYLAFVGWGTLALAVLIEAWVRSGNPFRAALRAMLTFNGAAFLTAVPWLAKNLFLLGNPVYPFFLGMYGLDGELHKGSGAAGGLSDWVAAGMGNDWKALLAFPYNVYVHWERFDPVKNRGGPSLFFWFLPLYLVVKKQPLISFLLGLVVIRFVVWWELTQFVRYALILFPLLSVICGYIVWELVQRLKGRWTRPLLGVAIALFVLVGIFLQWGFFLALRDGAVAFVLGLESQATFLDTNLHDAGVTRFMNATLPPDSKVFALGDTRVFYLTRAVIGDVAHTNWADLAELGQTVDGMREQMRRLGVTHVWVSEDEITYSKNFWNIPAPWENQTVSFDEFRARYLKELYHDEKGHTVYALTP